MILQIGLFHEAGGPTSSESLELKSSSVILASSPMPRCHYCQCQNYSDARSKSFVIHQRHSRARCMQMRRINCAVLYRSKVSYMGELPGKELIAEEAAIPAVAHDERLI
jgi:hypothetical protein